MNKHAQTSGQIKNDAGPKQEMQNMQNMQKASLKHPPPPPRSKSLRRSILAALSKNSFHKSFLFILLYFFTFLLILSCKELDNNDDDAPDPQFSFEVFAGSGAAGFANGQGTAAQFQNPEGATVTADGTIYVTGSVNHRIRKITPTGLVSTFAGSSPGIVNGQGIAAQFGNPIGIVNDRDGNLYVADSGNHRIRKITPAGLVSIFAGSGTAGSADGQGAAAQFNLPYAVAIGPAGNFYVADTSGNRIRKITPAGLVSTLTGSGGTALWFNAPQGIAVAADGTIYVAATTGNRIRKITPAGQVSTLAGSGALGFADGKGTNAQFSGPAGMAISPKDGKLYVGDTTNSRIRRIVLSGSAEGTVSTIMHVEGWITDIAFSTDGATAYVVSRTGHRIYKLENPSFAPDLP